MSNNRLDIRNTKETALIRFDTKEDACAGLDLKDQQNLNQDCELTLPSFKMKGISTGIGDEIIS